MGSCLLHVAREETIKHEDDALLDRVDRVQVVAQREHVAIATLSGKERSGAARIGKGMDRRLAQDLLTWWQQDGASQPEDTGVGRITILPMNQVGRAAHITRETSTGGEVEGGEIGDRGLLTGAEGPMQLLFGLVVESIHVLDRTGSIPNTGAANEERGKRPVITVTSNLTSSTASDAKDWIAEAREYSER